MALGPSTPKWTSPIQDADADKLRDDAAIASAAGTYAPDFIPEKEDLFQFNKTYESNVGGVANRASLYSAAGVKDNMTFSQHLSSGGQIPKGYELDAKLEMAREKRYTYYNQYLNGEMGKSQFLYNAYGKDIMKNQGYDLSSYAFWRQWQKENPGTASPLNNPYFVETVLAEAERMFQYEEFYRTFNTNLQDTKLGALVGQEVTAQQMKDIFPEYEQIAEQLGSWENLRKYMTSGMLKGTLDPLIDTNDDGKPDYYLHTNGLLYKCHDEGEDGAGSYNAKVYYNSDGSVDRVSLNGNGWGDFGRSALKGFAQFFTGIMDLGAMAGMAIGAAFSGDFSSNFTEWYVGYESWKNTTPVLGWILEDGVYQPKNEWEWDDISRGLGQGLGMVAGIVATWGIGAAVSAASAAVKGGTAIVAQGAKAGTTAAAQKAVSTITKKGLAHLAKSQTDDVVKAGVKKVTAEAVETLVKSQMDDLIAKGITEFSEATIRELAEKAITELAEGVAKKAGKTIATDAIQSAMTKTLHTSVARTIAGGVIQGVGDVINISTGLRNGSIANKITSSLLGRSAISAAILTSRDMLDAYGTMKAMQPLTGQSDSEIAGNVWAVGAMNFVVSTLLRSTTDDQGIMQRANQLLTKKTASAATGAMQKNLASSVIGRFMVNHPHTTLLLNLAADTFENGFTMVAMNTIKGGGSIGEAFGAGAAAGATMGFSSGSIDVVVSQFVNTGMALRGAMGNPGLGAAGALDASKALEGTVQTLRNEMDLAFSKASNPDVAQAISRAKAAFENDIASAVQKGTDPVTARFEALDRLHANTLTADGKTSMVTKSFDKVIKRALTDDFKGFVKIAYDSLKATERAADAEYRKFWDSGFVNRMRKFTDVLSGVKKWNKNIDNFWRDAQVEAAVSLRGSLINFDIKDLDTSSVSTIDSAFKELTKMHELFMLAKKEDDTSIELRLNDNGIINPKKVLERIANEGGYDPRELEGYLLVVDKAFTNLASDDAKKAVMTEGLAELKRYAQLGKEEATSRGIAPNILDVSDENQTAFFIPHRNPGAFIGETNKVFGIMHSAYAVKYAKTASARATALEHLAEVEYSGAFKGLSDNRADWTPEQKVEVNKAEHNVLNRLFETNHITAQYARQLYQDLGLDMLGRSTTLDQAMRMYKSAEKIQEYMDIKTALTKAQLDDMATLLRTFTDTGGDTINSYTLFKLMSDGAISRRQLDYVAERLKGKTRLGFPLSSFLNVAESLEAGQRFGLSEQDIKFISEKVMGIRGVSDYTYFDHLDSIESTIRLEVQEASYRHTRKHKGGGTQEVFREKAYLDAQRRLFIDTLVKKGISQSELARVQGILDLSKQKGENIYDFIENLKKDMPTMSIGAALREAGDAYMDMMEGTDLLTGSSKVTINFRAIMPKAFVDAMNRLSASSASNAFNDAPNKLDFILTELGVNRTEFTRQMDYLNEILLEYSVGGGKASGLIQTFDLKTQRVELEEILTKLGYHMSDLHTHKRAVPFGMYYNPDGAKGITLTPGKKFDQEVISVQEVNVRDILSESVDDLQRSLDEALGVGILLTKNSFISPEQFIASAIDPDATGGRLFIALQNAVKAYSGKQTVLGGKGVDFVEGLRSFGYTGEEIKTIQSRLAMYSAIATAVDFAADTEEGLIHAVKFASKNHAAQAQKYRDLGWTVTLLGGTEYLISFKGDSQAFKQKLFGMLKGKANIRDIIPLANNITKEKTLFYHNESVTTRTKYGGRKDLAGAIVADAPQDQKGMLELALLQPKAVYDVGEFVDKPLTINPGSVENVMSQLDSLLQTNPSNFRAILLRNQLKIALAMSEAISEAYSEQQRKAMSAIADNHARHKLVEMLQNQEPSADIAKAINQINQTRASSVDFTGRLVSFDVDSGNRYERSALTPDALARYSPTAGLYYDGGTLRSVEIDAADVDYLRALTESKLIDGDTSYKLALNGDYDRLAYIKGALSAYQRVDASGNTTFFLSTSDLMRMREQDMEEVIRWLDLNNEQADSLRMRWAKSMRVLAPRLGVQVPSQRRVRLSRYDNPSIEQTAWKAPSSEAALEMAKQAFDNSQIADAQRDLLFDNGKINSDLDNYNNLQKFTTANAQYVSDMNSDSFNHQGSAIVANLSRRQEAGRLVYAIGEVAHRLRTSTQLKDAGIKISKAAAVSLADKMYTATTGTEMQSTFDKYFFIDEKGNLVDTGSYQRSGWYEDETDLYVKVLKNTNAKAVLIVDRNALYDTDTHNMFVINLNDVKKRETLLGIATRDIISKAQGREDYDPGATVSETISSYLRHYMSEADRRRLYVSEFQKLFGWKNERIARKMLPVILDYAVNNPNAAYNSEAFVNTLIAKGILTLDGADAVRMKQQRNAWVTRLNDLLGHGITREVLTEDAEQIINRNLSLDRDIRNTVRELNSDPDYRTQAGSVERGAEIIKEFILERMSGEDIEYIFRGQRHDGNLTTLRDKRAKAIGKKADFTVNTDNPVLGGYKWSEVSSRANWYMDTEAMFEKTKRKDATDGSYPFEVSFVKVDANGKVIARKTFDIEPTIIFPDGHIEEIGKTEAYSAWEAERGSHAVWLKAEGRRQKLADFQKSFIKWFESTLKPDLMPSGKASKAGQQKSFILTYNGSKFDLPIFLRMFDFNTAQQSIREVFEGSHIDGRQIITNNFAEARDIIGLKRNLDSFRKYMPELAVDLKAHSAEDDAIFLSRLIPRLHEDSNNPEMLQTSFVKTFDSLVDRLGLTGKEADVQAELDKQLKDMYDELNKTKFGKEYKSYKPAGLTEINEATRRINSMFMADEYRYFQKRFGKAVESYETTSIKELNDILLRRSEGTRGIDKVSDTLAYMIGKIITGSTKEDYFNALQQLSKLLSDSIGYKHTTDDGKQISFLNEYQSRELIKKFTTADGIKEVFDSINSNNHLYKFSTSELDNRTKGTGYAELKNLMAQVRESSTFTNGFSERGVTVRPYETIERVRQFKAVEYLTRDLQSYIDKLAVDQETKDLLLNHSHEFLARTIKRDSEGNPIFSDKPLFKTEEELTGKFMSWLKSTSADSIFERFTKEGLYSLITPISNREPVKLTDGRSVKPSPDTLYYNAATFKQMFGTDIVSYREKNGLKPDAPVYVASLRQPTNSSDTIHAYKVEITNDTSSALSVRTLSDVQYAKHNGDFDGDDVTMFLLNKASQKIAAEMNRVEFAPYHTLENLIYEISSRRGFVHNKSNWSAERKHNIEAVGKNALESSVRRIMAEIERGVAPQDAYNTTIKALAKSTGVDVKWLSEWFLSFEKLGSDTDFALHPRFEINQASSGATYIKDLTEFWQNKSVQYNAFIKSKSIDLATQIAGMEFKDWVSLKEVSDNNTTLYRPLLLSDDTKIYLDKYFEFLQFDSKGGMAKFNSLLSVLPDFDAEAKDRLREAFTNGELSSNDILQELRLIEIKARRKGDQTFLSNAVKKLDAGTYGEGADEISAQIKSFENLQQYYDANRNTLADDIFIAGGSGISKQDLYNAIAQQVFGQWTDMAGVSERIELFRNSDGKIINEGIVTTYVLVDDNAEYVDTLSINSKWKKEERDNLDVYKAVRIQVDSGEAEMLRKYIGTDVSKINFLNKHFKNGIAWTIKAIEGDSVYVEHQSKLSTESKIAAVNNGVLKGTVDLDGDGILSIQGAGKVALSSIAAVAPSALFRGKKLSNTDGTDGVKVTYKVRNASGKIEERTATLVRADLTIVEDTELFNTGIKERKVDYNSFYGNASSLSSPLMFGTLIRHVDQDPDSPTFGKLVVDTERMARIQNFADKLNYPDFTHTNGVGLYQRLIFATLLSHLPEDIPAEERKRVQDYWNNYVMSPDIVTAEGQARIQGLIDKYFGGKLTIEKLGVSKDSIEARLLSDELFDIIHPKSASGIQYTGESFLSKGEVQKSSMATASVFPMEMTGGTDKYGQYSKVSGHIATKDLVNYLLGDNVLSNSTIRRATADNIYNLGEAENLGLSGNFKYQNIRDISNRNTGGLEIHGTKGMGERSANQQFLPTSVPRNFSYSNEDYDVDAALEYRRSLKKGGALAYDKGFSFGDRTVDVRDQGVTPDQEAMANIYNLIKAMTYADSSNKVSREGLTGEFNPDMPKLWGATPSALAVDYNDDAVNVKFINQSLNGLSVEELKKQLPSLFSNDIYYDTEGVLDEATIKKNFTDDRRRAVSEEEDAELKSMAEDLQSSGGSVLGKESDAFKRLSAIYNLENPEQSDIPQWTRPIAGENIQRNIKKDWLSTSGVRIEDEFTGGVDTSLTAYNRDIRYYRGMLQQGAKILYAEVTRSAGGKQEFDTFIRNWSILDEIRTATKIQAERILAHENDIRGTSFDTIEELMANIKPSVELYRQSHQSIAGRVQSIYDNIKAASQDYADKIGEPPALWEVLQPLSHASTERKVGDVIKTTNDVLFGRSNLTTSITAARLDFFTGIDVVTSKMSKAIALYNLGDRLQKIGALDNAEIMLTLEDEIQKAIKNNSDEKQATEFSEMVFENIARKVYGFQVTEEGTLAERLSQGIFLLRQMRDELAQKGNLGDRPSYARVKEMSEKNLDPETAADRRKYMAVVESYTDLVDGLFSQFKGVQDVVVANLKNLAGTNLVFVDKYGRIRDINDYKAMVKPLYDVSFEYITTNVKNGSHVDKLSYERAFILNAIEGELFLANKSLAEFMDKEYFTTEVPKKVMSSLSKISLWSTKLLMSSLPKLLDRLVRFTAFDLSITGISAPKSILHFPEARREISAMYQSKGASLDSSPQLKEFIKSIGYDPINMKGLNPANMEEGITMPAVLNKYYFDFTDKLFSQQTLTTRYAMWLAVKESFDKADSNPTKKPIYGVAYANKETVDALETSGEKAMFVVDQTFGGPGGFPFISKKLGGVAMFTTFPLALLRYGREGFRSASRIVSEAFQGEYSGAFKNMVVPALGLVGLTIISNMTYDIIAEMFNVDEEEKEKWKKEGTFIDPISTVLQGRPMTVQGNSINPLHQLQELLGNPLDWEDKTLLDKFKGVLSNNVVSKLNPIIKTPIELATKKDFIGETMFDTSNDFGVWENLARKIGGYLIGSSGATAMVRDWQQTGVDTENPEWYQRLKSAIGAAIGAELGNNRGYKSQVKDYYRGLGLVNTWIATEKYEDVYEKLENGNVTNGNFDSGNYDWLKNKIRDSVSAGAKASVIYGWIDEAIKRGFTKNEIVGAMRATSIAGRLSLINDTEGFFATLSEKDLTILEQALVYEENTFPFLQEILSQLTDKGASSYSYNRYIPRFYQKNYDQYKQYRDSAYRNKYNNYYNNNNSYNKKKGMEDMEFDKSFIKAGSNYVGSKAKKAGVKVRNTKPVSTKRKKLAKADTRKEHATTSGTQWRND